MLLEHSWSLHGSGLPCRELGHGWAVGGPCGASAFLQLLGGRFHLRRVDPEVTLAAPASDIEPGFALVCKGDLPPATQGSG